jgi:hypothetical protein
MNIKIYVFITHTYTHTYISYILHTAYSSMVSPPSPTPAFYHLPTFSLQDHSFPISLENKQVKKQTPQTNQNKKLTNKRKKKGNTHTP